MDPDTLGIARLGELHVPVIVRRILQAATATDDVTAATNDVTVATDDVIAGGLRRLMDFTATTATTVAPPMMTVARPMTTVAPPMTTVALLIPDGASTMDLVHVVVLGLVVACMLLFALKILFDVTLRLPAPSKSY
ncbi:hypothetical protein BV898_05644 [Hypsibius exemplaris]|uniref:Uncharacterized protein n=1 Tax=Hypsibius exemplaris TaxID=2072580 RepID=A0A1W0WYT3_HYPEX|nr:hypothetical protein BV898_05644 [Hypsibius exemplaris]